jgi:hypothetical protein
MKISVRYGLYTSVAVVAWMMFGYIFKLDKVIGGNGGLIALIFYAVGIYFSVKHTKDKESNGVLDPRIFLKAGLITASIVSIAYCIFIFFLYESLDRGGVGIGSKIMGMIMLFIMNVLIGGLLAVMLAFFYARKKD